MAPIDKKTKQIDLEAVAAAGAAAARAAMAKRNESASPPSKKARHEPPLVAESPQALGASASAGSGVAAVVLGSPGVRPVHPKKAEIEFKGSRVFMAKCMPYVDTELPQFLMRQGVLESSEPMSRREPLQIKGDSMRSFKESWTPSNCAISLFQTNMYEAGGNLAWISGECSSQSLPCEDPPFKWLMEYEEIGFFEFQERIVFPVVMETFVEIPFLQSEMPRSMTPLGGHAYLYAWYYAAYKALGDQDTRRCQLLFECALCTTICVRVSGSPAELAELSTKFSERLRSDTKVIIDSFLTFSDKVLMMTDGKPTVADLVTRGIRYNGALMNLSMLRAINQVAQMTKRSREILEEIDLRFGKDWLSASYNKLRTMMSQASAYKGQGLGEGYGECLEWTLESLLVTLLRGEGTVQDFTYESFSKSKDGKPSWIAVACTQRIIVLHVQNIVHNLTDVDKTLADRMKEKILPAFASPLEFHRTFPLEKDEVSEALRQSETGTDEGTTDAGAEVQAQTSTGDLFMFRLSDTFPRSACLLAEFLKKVFDGTYSMPLQTLCNEKDALAELTKLELDLGAMSKDLREVLRSFTALESVSAANANAPKATLKELVRRSSDGGEDAAAAQAEREDIWKKVGAKRKSLATLALCKKVSAESLQEVFNLQGSGVRAFKGVLNESHRLFVVSCDLMGQSEKKPFLNSFSPDGKHFNEVLEFMTKQRDLTDIVLAFDGLDRTSRRRIKDSLMKLPCAAEIVVVYTQSPNQNFARKSFFGAKTTEVGCIVMPTNRGKLVVKDKAFGGKGDSDVAKTTYSSTYLSVDMVKRSDLPRIDPKEKHAITATQDEIPEKWKRAFGAEGLVPLYWLETKSTKFWIQLLRDLSVKSVMDVSPGSGSLAAACLESGVRYFGVVQSPVHMAWLNNYLDRKAIKFIAQAGSELYMEDLAPRIKELFDDLVNDEDGDGENTAKLSDGEADDEMTVT